MAIQERGWQAPIQDEKPTHLAGRFALTGIGILNLLETLEQLVETHSIATLHNIFVCMFFDRHKKQLSPIEILINERANALFVRWVE